MKKFLSLLLALTLVLGLFAGCGNSNNGEDNTQNNGSNNAGNTADDAGAANAGDVTFHYMIGAEPPGLDPSISQGDVQQSIYQALFEGLVTMDTEGNIAPAAATEWSVSDDGLVYTFKLREDAVWSDGQPVTANDFVYAWQRVLDPNTASTYSWFVEMFLKNATAFAQGEVGAEELGVKAVNDYTLEVTLASPATYFIQALLLGCWLPVRQDAVEANPDQWVYNADTCISNGPFCLEEYQIGSHISLVKNDKYWGADEVSIDKVKFTFMSGSTTALAAFRAGDADGFSGVPTEDLVDIITTDNRLYTFDRLSFSFLRLNTATEGLDNPLVRRAINLGIDRQAYMDGLGQGLTNTPALGTVPSGMMLDGKDFREVAGDHGLSTSAQIEEAQALLAEAGYPNGEGLPTYRLHCTTDARESAEVLQQMLETNLGIKTEILPVDSKLNWPMITEGDYDISYGGWGGDYTHPNTFLNLFTSTAYDNCTGWSNAEFDQLIADAAVETDEAKQLEMLVKAEDILMEESPIVPLMFPTTTLMMQDYVTDWYLSAFNVLYIRNAKVDRPAA